MKHVRSIASRNLALRLLFNYKVYCKLLLAALRSLCLWSRYEYYRRRTRSVGLRRASFARMLGGETGSACSRASKSASVPASLTYGSTTPRRRSEGRMAEYNGELNLNSMVYLEGIQIHLEPHATTLYGGYELLMCVPCTNKRTAQSTPYLQRRGLDSFDT